MKKFEILKDIKTCNNDCIFCFTKQLPKNLRKSLYVRDDDYILSYMYGNFITLTNISNGELNRIIKYRLYPLYISVHSMNDTVRSYIFGSKNSKKGIDNLKALDSNGIKTNIQIVLCPGINDRKKLAETLSILLKDFNNVISIGIVPVGITKFNRENNLRSLTKKEARGIINTIHDIRDGNGIFKEGGKVYLSDEFYILADMELPVYSYYGDFRQIRNGIGKSAEFLKQVSDYLETNHITKNIYDRKVLIVTSEYGKEAVGCALRLIEKKLVNTGRKKNLPAKILEVKNEFFGGNIKVTGLLTGKDITTRLKKENISLYEKIIIPDNIFNDDNLTIDDYSKRDIRRISSKIRIISEEGSSFIKELVS